MTNNRSHTNPFRAFVLAGLLLAVAACGGSSTQTADAVPATETPATAVAATEAPALPEVSIERSRFGPLELVVNAGDTVTFTNTDPFAHTVTSADGSPMEFDSGSFGQDETFEVTFNDPGTFAYFCQIHPTIRATVVVQ